MLTSCPGLTGASSTAQRCVFAHRIRISALEYWIARSKPGDDDQMESKGGPEARRFAETFLIAGVPGRSKLHPGLKVTSWTSSSPLTSSPFSPSSLS
jgi:hypothetical protein